jgi:hypothetical protein
LELFDALALTDATSNAAGLAADWLNATHAERNARVAIVVARVIGRFSLILRAQSRQRREGNTAIGPLAAGDMPVTTALMAGL